MSLVDPILPRNDERLVKWGKLYGAAPALAIAAAAPNAAGPLTVIAQSSREAEALSEAIRFFPRPSLPARHFPHLDTLPYHPPPPHPPLPPPPLPTPPHPP